MIQDKNTYCVIMAGGIGSRFWPMSTPELPKQFHDVLGIGRTLIRMTFERILPICPAENILVVTNERYKELVKKQLPEISDSQILCEPHMRNTAPCLAYANFWIQRKNKDANIVVLSSDQLITNELEFLNVIEKSINAAKETSSLVTLGIKPSHPNTGYGYIQFSEDCILNDDSVRNVITFTEKPDLETAQTFLESEEFYWNSGMFVWTLNSIQSAFKEFLPDMYDLFNEEPDAFCSEKEKAFIERIYPLCQNISIDFGIMESASNVLVLLSDFGWSDLGTWGSVYDNLAHDDNGNAVTQEHIAMIESSGNVIKLEEGRKAVIQGLNNFIVVEANGTLLICSKDQEQRIKAFSKAVR